MLTFYTNPQSRGRMARWALEETGAPYETKIIGYGEEMKSPAYLAINPMGKVPALDHDGYIVTETAAITAYLADAFPAANLAPPPGSPQRALYYRWLFFTAGPLESALLIAALKVEVPPERTRMAGYGTFGLVLDTLEAALAPGPYLLGDQFTAADIYLGAQLMFALRFKQITPRPAFVSYVERLTSRPAAQRAAALDDALIPPPAS
jgi:glutathione S-transferase